MAEAHRTLTGPWRPGHAARPLSWWDANAMHGLQQSLKGLCAAWAAAWGVHDKDVEARCEPAGSRSLLADRWIAFTGEAGAEAWLRLPPHDDEAFARALFHDAAPGDALARALAAACREDAIARMAKLLGFDGADSDGPAPPATLARTGSGAVEAVFAAPQGMRLLLAPGLAARWCKGAVQRPHAPREPLVVATAALANRPVQLQVELDGCQLEVGALQGLQVGDVVRLDHSLESPACVRHASAALCRAYLGRRGNRKAVELAGRPRAAASEALQ